MCLAATAKLGCQATPHQCTLPLPSPPPSPKNSGVVLSCAGRILHCRIASIMSAEVICLTSSSSDEEPSSSSPSRHRLVSRVASVNELATAAGGEKMARKRRCPSLAEPELNASPSHSKIRQVQNIPVQPGCSSQTAAVCAAPRKVVKPQLVAVTKIPIPPPDEDVFQNFVKACLKRRDDKDTKQVLLKLDKLHSKLSTIQRQDNEFRLLISNCHNMISKSLTKDIYSPILELHTEIKRLIKASVVEQQQNEEQQQQQQQEICDEKQLSEGNMKKIKLLESSIAKCLKKIKKLEEKEVDFDDDDNSAYIQEDKYKKRLIQLYNALSKVSGDKVLKRQLLRKKIKIADITGELTGIPLVDKAILDLINSDISKINQFKHLESTLRCADHIKMPEYLDILKCIDKCSKDSNLDLRKEKMEKLAKRAFSTVGNFLKKKRTDETKCYFQSFLDETCCQDPANKDVELHKKLCENKKEGDKKLDEIFEKYVDKQKGLSQKDMEEQQRVSSDTEDDHNSISSSSSSDESYDSSKQQQQDETEKTVAPKSKSISSSDVDDDDKNEESAQKCLDTADGNDDGNDLLLDVTDIDASARDSLDNQVSSPAIETKKLPQSNKILNAESGPRRPVSSQTKSLTPTTIKAAQQRNVSPPPPRNKPVTATVDIVSEENSGEPIGSCCLPTNKRPVIQVCAFAKPPAAWGSMSASPSSPEKAKKTTLKPRTADSSFTKLRSSSSPECIDLTKEERERQLSVSPRLPKPIAARSINPLANKKRSTSSPAATAAVASSLHQPAKRVVIVKNVINNFHVPLSDASAAAAAAAAVGPRGKNVFHPSRSSSTFGKHSRDTVWLSKDKKK